jgi:hypothetical protein
MGTRWLGQERCLIEEAVTKLPTWVGISETDTVCYRL